MITTATGIKCQITIKTATGVTRYDGIFKTTIDATIDAIERLGGAQGSVSAKAMP